MHLKKITLFPEKYPAKDCYPFKLHNFNVTRVLAFHTAITFFVGENGTGKSTLLKAIARKCNIHIWEPEEGRRFEFNRYEEELYKYIGVEWTDGVVPGSFFASAIFQHFTNILDEWAAASPKILEYFGGKSLMTQSHGQCHMSYFKNRFQRKGLYFLDEPENALSPKTQLEFLSVLKDMSQENHAQFIIATHSPILLASPNATIYSFDHAPISQINYEDTSHYQIYKEFLNDRKKYW
ncbi:MAG: AAA family ATPase [Proteobacteria bacterium]|jgi:predicted ATPase|nr:AAA family ATPase [Pseudomonadota bacterium]